MLVSRTSGSRICTGRFKHDAELLEIAPKALQNWRLKASNEWRASLALNSDFVWTTLVLSASACGCRARMRLMESILMAAGRLPEAWMDWIRARAAVWAMVWSGPASWNARIIPVAASTPSAVLGK